VAGIGFNAQVLNDVYLSPPELGQPPAFSLLCLVARCLTWPISYRFFAGRHRMFHLLSAIPGWLLFPSASSLGRPLEPIIGIGTLLLSDFVGYHLELRSRRAFIQRVARSV
jgi:hypothetical protein